MVDVMPIMQRNPALLHKGRLLDLVFDFLVDSQRYRVTVRKGDIALAPQADGADACAFEMRASRSAWEAYASVEKTPQFHDLIAMVEYGHLSVTGDLLPFFRNLFLIKGIMASAWRGDASW
jgi:hypothetical protein